MTVRWSNVVVIGLILFALIWGFSHKADLSVFSATLDDAAVSSDPVRQFKGLVSYGVIAVTVLAILKIIFSGRDRSGGGGGSGG